jgi:hypothetical protein
MKRMKLNKTALWSQFCYNIVVSHSEHSNRIVGTEPTLTSLSATPALLQLLLLLQSERQRQVNYSAKSC